MPIENISLYIDQMLSLLLLTIAAFFAKFHLHKDPKSQIGFYCSHFVTSYKLVELETRSNNSLEVVIVLASWKFVPELLPYYTLLQSSFSHYKV
jgi:hypothetical protein